MTPERPDKLPEYAVSDEAAAYIADALMELALQFEAAHFAQIRRHYQSIAPKDATAILGNPILSGKLRRSDPGSGRVACFQNQLRFLVLFLGSFFCSTRAASILPSRPPNLAAAAHRACQGWPRLWRPPEGLGLDGAEHGGILDRTGAGGCQNARGRGPNRLGIHSVGIQ